MAKRKRTRERTFSEFVILAECISNIDEVVQNAREMPKPSTLGGVPVPDNLNHITYGTYIKLTQLGDKLFTDAPKLLLNCDVMDEPYSTVIRFGEWVASELARIGQLFASTKVEPTAEEKQAGVDKLHFGIFGIIDWFAQRMHISHDEVEKVNWMIIYKCLDIEAERTRFNRRLRAVLNNNTKR